MRLAVVVLLLLTGCALYQPKPDEKHVRFIEERLEGHPCIGAMSTWARQYYHTVRRYLDRSIELADTGTIRFQFREAGRFGRRAGKTILHSRGDGSMSVIT